jgi:bifunctional UDP-N-acetylglucosamine pyrophosphorylase/glucosamine-1-phosphate N-acetyltransferase
MHKKGYVVRSFMAEDQAEVMGVNDRWELGDSGECDKAEEF